MDWKKPAAFVGVLGVGILAYAIVTMMGGSPEPRRSIEQDLPTETDQFRVTGEAREAVEVQRQLYSDDPAVRAQAKWTPEPAEESRVGTRDERQQARHALDWAEPDPRITEATKAIARRNFDEAEQVIDEVLADEPTNAHAHFTKAHSLWMQGEVDETFAYIKGVADEHSDVPALRYIQARIYQLANRQEEARKSYKAYLEATDASDPYHEAVTLLVQSLERP